MGPSCRGPYSPHLKIGDNKNDPEPNSGKTAKLFGSLSDVGPVCGYLGSLIEGTWGGLSRA